MPYFIIFTWPLLNWLWIVGWKFHRMTKILLWNVTKQDLFFNIIALMVNTLVCSTSIDWSKKRFLQQIYHMNFFSPALFYEENALNFVWKEYYKNCLFLFTWLWNEYIHMYSKVNWPYFQIFIWTNFLIQIEV